MDVTYNGEARHLEGSGYHDHNWGNISVLKLIHHWYWGRAKMGDYKEFDVFMLAKGDKILGDNSNHTLKFLPQEEYMD